MKTIRTIESALQVFLDSAIKQARATENGDYKTGNKHMEIMDKCLIYLHDNQRLDALLPFLSYDDAGVRVSAAYGVLSIDESQAISVLTEIEEGFYGIHCVNAECLIKQWYNGQIRFPWNQC